MLQLPLYVCIVHSGSRVIAHRTPQLPSSLLLMPQDTKVARVLAFDGWGLWRWSCGIQAFSWPSRTTYRCTALATWNSSRDSGIAWAKGIRSRVEAWIPARPSGMSFCTRPIFSTGRYGAQPSRTYRIHTRNKMNKEINNDIEAHEETVPLDILQPSIGPCIAEFPLKP